MAKKKSAVSTAAEPKAATEASKPAAAKKGPVQYCSAVPVPYFPP